MNLTCIGFGVVIVVAGILFALGKLLPREWKKMSDEEKAKVRLKPLCANVGIMIILCGAIVLTRGLWAAFGGRAFVIAMIVWIVASVIDVFFISKSRRYKNGETGNSTK